jgi:hypothetical protein
VVGPLVLMTPLILGQKLIEASVDSRWAVEEPE